MPDPLDDLTHEQAVRMAMYKLSVDQGAETAAYVERLVAAGFSESEAKRIVFRSYLAGWRAGMLAHGLREGVMPDGERWALLGGNES